MTYKLTLVLDNTDERPGAAPAKTYHLPRDLFPPLSTGKWEVALSKVKFEQWQYKATATLSWSDCTQPANLVSGSLVFGGVSRPLPQGIFPSTQTGSLVLEVAYGSTRKVVLNLEVVPAVVEEKDFVVACSAIEAPPTPPVCLSFPNGRQLYVSAALLESISPYWRERLAATEFSDGGDKDDGEDSDDDADDLSRADSTVPVFTEYRQLGVSSFSYTTYRAFLTSTQNIVPTFAPLTSTNSLSGGTAVSPAAAKAAHLVCLRTYQSFYPSLPLPVSPKSLYRLAHFLQVPAVQKVALERLKSRLTVDNVAFELFSPFAALYEDVAEVELDFALDHIVEVRQSAGLEAVIEEIEKGEPAGRDKTLLLALKALRGTSEEG
ncbi:hypothetical protein JCM8097_007883 [Rhodosporidiobolus ruineniae]